MSSFDYAVRQGKFSGKDRLGNLEDTVSVLLNGSPRGTFPGNLVTTIGDSLMLGPTGTSNPTQLDAASLYGWACALSNNRFQNYDSQAVGGVTTSTMLASQLPAVLALNPKPAACLVMGGTNDIGNGVATSSIMVNLAAILTGLLNAGIAPVVVNIPPRTGKESATSALNRQLERYCAKNGISYVDIYSLVVDPSTGAMLTAYDNGDHIHLSAVGGKLCGAFIAANIVALFPYCTPWLSGYNADPNVSLANPLLLTDTNADGVPDQWSLSLGSGATVALAADPSAASTTLNGATTAGADSIVATSVTGMYVGGLISIDTGVLMEKRYIIGISGTTLLLDRQLLLAHASLVAVTQQAAVSGNAWSITRGAADIAYQSTGVAGSVGDRYAFAMRVKATPAASGTYDVRMFGTQSGVTMVRPMQNWTLPIDWQTIYGEGLLPTGNTTAKLQVMVQTGTGSVLQIAQPTFINLTAAGYA